MSAHRATSPWGQERGTAFLPASPPQAPAPNRTGRAGSAVQAKSALKALPSPRERQGKGEKTDSQRVGGARAAEAAWRQELLFSELRAKKFTFPLCSFTEL